MSPLSSQLLRGIFLKNLLSGLVALYPAKHYFPCVFTIDMTTLPNTDDYLALFLRDTPMMDVRAPVEAVRGSFPNSVNHPLLDNEQRKLIGIRYKQQGESKAVQLGLELATPDIREQRHQAWSEFCKTNPQGYLYCFRGGLRSRTTQQWLKERGIHYPLVTGGYKAMRRFLIDELEVSLQNLNFVSITGPTGSGKTRLLKRLQHHVDFEGLANHRGSAFGRNPTDTQPSNIDWENSVSIAMLKHRHTNPKATIFIEDESKLIGRVCMAQNVEAMCKRVPLVLLEETMEMRVTMTREDYIDNLWPEYQALYSEHAEEKFSTYVLGALSRIKKRLGGLRYSQLNRDFELALKELYQHHSSDGFSAGIEILLSDYYDPMYQYQRSHREDKIIFRGTRNEVLDWAKQKAK